MATQETNSEEASPQPKGVQLREYAVVGVVGLLGGVILYKLFAGPMPTANERPCPARMRQIALASAAYTEAWDDTLVPREMPSGANYSDLLEPYIKDRSVWICPRAGSTERSIGPNRAISPDLSKAKSKPVPASLIESPDKTILFSDDAPARFSLDVPSARDACHVVVAKQNGDPITDDQEYALTRHDGLSDYVFTDGHSKFLSAKETLMPRILWFVGDHRLSEYGVTAPQSDFDCAKIGKGNAKDPTTGL